MKRRILTLGMLFTTLLFFLPFAGNAFAANHNGQNVTAYVAPIGSKTYYGTSPVIYNTAAVRPKICGSPVSGTKLPRGTVIKTSIKLGFPDSVSRDTFNVYDMGDVSCSSSLTPYFFDIYFGANTPSNKSKAFQFGKKKVNYVSY